MPYGSLMEAIYTLNSPPVVSFKTGFGYLSFAFKFWGIGATGLGLRVGVCSSGVWSCGRRVDEGFQAFFGSSGRFGIRFHSLAFRVRA